MSSQNLTKEQKDALLKNLQVQVQISHLQSLLHVMTEKCFKKCVPKPGTALDSGEAVRIFKSLQSSLEGPLVFGKRKRCLSSCTDRFMESFNVVARSFADRIRQERLKFSKD